MRHAPDDAALRRVIRQGIAGTGMPATWLNEGELLDVSAHVRSMARLTGPAVPAPGDRTRGQQIYLGKGGCARCHTIDGRGGAFGPDLTGIGSLRSAAHLTASIIDPAADIPPGFLLTNAVPAAPGGRTITGARVNEDTFSVQIRDASGTLHSFWKTELRQLRKEPGKSGMPSFKGALTGAEIDDVVAYLAGLEEAQ